MQDSAHLDRILIRGVAWTAAVKWLTQLLTWGTTVVIAHVLVPSDYGLVGMAAIYINLVTLFSEFGIGTAVVSLQDLSPLQTSQLNTVSVCLGFLGLLVSAAAALPLGLFFHAPRLPGVVLVLSLGFVVSGIRTVPYALLEKEMRFKRLAAIEAVQGIGQALVTLGLAYLGLGAWALVGGMLAFAVIPAGLTLASRRQGFAVPRLASIRGAIHYSRDILIGRLSWAVYNDSDFIVAGRVLGAAPLGAYTLAWTLAFAPLDKLTTLVGRVTPSVFARIQTDPAALRRYLKSITGVMALILFPATIGLALVAPEFVPLVLGRKWGAAVVPLELLALHAVMRSNVILTGPLLYAIGEARIGMWISLSGMLVLPACFFLGSHWGPTGIAAVWVGVYPFLQIPQFRRIFRRLDLRARDYFATLWPAIRGCVVMAIAIGALKELWSDSWPLYLRLIAEIGLGVVAYASALLLVHRAYLRELLAFVRTLRTVPA